VEFREWGHDVLSANDGNQALEILRSDTAISVALVDWMMPGLDGIEVCRRLRAMADRPYTYLISITSRNEKQDLICALEAGFDDFISKPVQPAELNARLLVGRRIVELQQKLIESCEISQFKATHDSLTGVWNRGAIMEFLRAQVAMAIRKSANLALMMVDVDHFKNVNDTYGHAAGDAVLIHLAQVMNSVIRTSDWLGRYGGEEFLIFASESNDAIRLAERIRITVEENAISYGELLIPATVSIGIGNSRSLATPSAESLIKLADEALYKAKNNGRNRVETDSDYLPPSLNPAGFQAVDSVTH